MFPGKRVYDSHPISDTLLCWKLRVHSAENFVILFLTNINISLESDTLTKTNFLLLVSILNSNCKRGLNADDITTIVYKTRLYTIQYGDRG